MSHDTLSPARDAVRMFNKHILNPAMLLLAGRKHWYAAVIHHVGRNSGRTYATPVVADRVADGFVVPLPYGPDVDWLRNAQVAGTATITIGGTSFEVAHPRIVDASVAADLLTSSRRNLFRRCGIDHFAKFDLTPGSSEEHHG